MINSAPFPGAFFSCILKSDLGKQLRHSGRIIAHHCTVKPQVFLCAHIAVQRRRLNKASGSAARLAEAAVKKSKAAAAVLSKTENQPYKGCFSGTVFADKAVNIALLYMQTDFIHDCLS